MTDTQPTRTLLAVDLGIRTGLALYADTGRLLWYLSHNYGAAARLRRSIPNLLADLPHLGWLALEGGGDLALAWITEARRKHVDTLQVAAETWRAALLLPREQRTGRQAKRHADRLARRVIAWSGAPRPTALRHDTAEAILIGLWAVLEVGWLERPPDELRG